MRLKRKPVILAILLAVVAIVVAHQLLNREPSYQGRKLSEWIKRYDDAEVNSAAEVAAADAILAIGTNALPCLLDWIQHEPGWRERLHNELPSEITDHRVVEDWLGAPEQRADAASSAFMILGTNAASAIPKLERMMRNTTKGQTSDNAIDALGSIGEPALPVLKAALAESNEINRESIVWQFQYMALKGQTNTYLPLLVAALTHPDQNVRHMATNAVFEIAPQFVPDEASRRRTSPQNIRVTSPPQ